MSMTLRAGVWPSFGALIQRGLLGTVAALMIAAPNLAPADQLIEVAAGDSAGFMDAIQAANGSPDKTVIRLNGSLDYRFDLASEAPAAITGHILLPGDGARLTGAGAGSYGTLFDVREGASLELTDLIISEFYSEDTEE